MCVGSAKQRLVYLPLFFNKITHTTLLHKQARGVYVCALHPCPSPVGALDAPITTRHSTLPRHPMPSKHPTSQPVTIMATTSTAPTSTTTTPVDTATIIANLQHQLQIVEQERDDLARDVEALCMSGADPSGISSSSVVSERIRIQDEQLADHRTRLAVALADAASLREDNAALRDSKRVADQGWRTESQRAADLERELQFYQTQSARAMSDRDRATWEADELRRRVDDLEQALERERGLFLAEQGQRQQAEAAGASAQEQIAALRIELKGLDVVPGLRTTIARLETETQQLQESLGSVQEELARRVEEVEGLKRRLEQVQGQLQGARDGNAKLEKKVASAKEKHAAEVFQLQVCRMGRCGVLQWLCAAVSGVVGFVRHTS